MKSFMKERIKLFFKINWLSFFKLNFLNRRIKRNKGYIIPFFGAKIKVDKSSIFVLHNKNVFVGSHNELALRKKTFIRVINNSIFVVGGSLGIGQGAFIHVNCGGSLNIASGSIGNDTKIGCEKEITIGDDFLCAREVNIRDNDSHYIFKNKVCSNPPSSICIGSHVWICDNVLILKGTTIGDNTVIGARSIINKSVENDSCVINKIEKKSIPIDTWDK